MEKIIAVSGRPGLYEIQSQTRVGVVATNLSDGKRIVTQPTDQVSVLSDIQIYTYAGEVPLETVFEKIHTKENGAVAGVSPKAPTAELKAYFAEVLPDYDEERVYASDIKKMVQWYGVLQTQKRFSFKKKAAPKKAAPKKGKGDQ
ncbi:MAG: DUF5606 domain-containing protein [Flavobacteriales bacterium]|jgi:hypothetical protein|nr:DUF5606 domain-containing protein [Flavobacteriales bacterium]